MATIKKIKLQQKSGLLSELQSDTIFGHFAWRFKEEYGDYKLTEFLRLYTEGNPVFSISDGFLEKGNTIYFPKPYKLTPSKFQSETKQKRIKSFLEQKKSKTQRLITIDQLNFYLAGDLENFERSLIETKANNLPRFNTDLRVHVEIDRNTFSSKEGQLFTENPKYLDKSTYIVIFVKVLDAAKWTEFNCESILSNAFSTGYGKKKSAGYGYFDIISFENFIGFIEPAQTNGFISLSQMLPANSDGIEEAYYELNVKYGKFGEEKSNAKNPFKKPLILFKPGSCFKSEIKQDFYGRAADKISDYLPNVVHNGIAFSLAAYLN